MIVLAPTTNRKGVEHPALQKVLDRHQDTLVGLVPRHGVQPARLRPATIESIVPYKQGEKLELITKGIEGAKEQIAKKKAITARRKKQRAYG